MAAVIAAAIAFPATIPDEPPAIPPIVDSGAEIRSAKLQVIDAVKKYKKEQARKKRLAKLRERLARERRERIARIKARFALPVSRYHLTARFGECSRLWSSCHTGLDFAAPVGTLVHSVSAGRIVSAGWAGAYGNRIILRHANGTESWYCHLSRLSRTSGYVAVRTVLGRVGATGNVTGPHLHLEIRPGGGAPVNPYSWLAARYHTP